MINSIALKEIRALSRERKLWLLSGILFCLFLAALAASFVIQQRSDTEISDAQRMTRIEWLEQGSRNPHSAAHFGNFAFRPNTRLKMFDNGLNAYTGTQVFLEPHKQDDFKFSEAEDADSIMRFGTLTPAFILQTIVPLLIIFLSFGSVSDEKENGTIKLLLGNGVTMQQLVCGKMLGNWAIISLLVSMLILASVLWSPAMINADAFARIAILFLIYTLYSGVVITICVVVSAHTATSRGALIKLLSLWIFACIILPKICGSSGSTLYATPSQFEYAVLVKEDEENGLDGHNPHDERREILLKATLKKYNADSVSDLPVNFDAIAMMESEKYTTEVYRKRIAEVREIFNKQNQIGIFAAFINPFQATQNASMLICGSNYDHFAHFQDAAENYRLYFVNKMNDYMATHTRSGDWQTRFGKELYTIVEPFNYKEPSVEWSLLQQPLVFIAIIAWILLSVLLVRSTATINILR